MVMFYAYMFGTYNVNLAVEEHRFKGEAYLTVIIIDWRVLNLMVKVEMPLFECAAMSPSIQMTFVFHTSSSCQNLMMKDEKL